MFTCARHYLFKMETRYRYLFYDPTLKITDYLFLFSFEEEDYLLDYTGVFLLAYVASAGTDASSHVVFQAGAGARSAD